MRSVHTAKISTEPISLRNRRAPAVLHPNYFGESLIFFIVPRYVKRGHIRLTLSQLSANVTSHSSH